MENISVLILVLLTIFLFCHLYFTMPNMSLISPYPINNVYIFWHNKSIERLQRSLHMSIFG